MPARSPSDLDLRLDAYAARGEALRPLPRKAWALYTAAAGAALAASSSAEAAISYSGIQNLQIDATAGNNYGSNTDSESIDIDLDGDLQNDFRFRVEAFRNVTSVGTVEVSWRATGSDLNSGSFVGSGGQINRLAYGSLVGTPFVTGPSQVLFGTVNTTTGTGSFSGTGFAGVRFLIGGNTHYGWIQLLVNNTGPGEGFLRIIDWAYETTPDTPIDAGAMPVPEPSALSLLALGTAGLGLYRRQRTRLAAPEQREADAA